MNVDDWLSQQTDLDEAARRKVREAYENDQKAREDFKKPLYRDSPAVIIGAQGFPGGLTNAL